jgi:hypothetical protein
MSEHTPGPWEYGLGAVYSIHFSIRTKQQRRKVADISVAWKNSDEFQANCKLIAAAPDMAEVLQMIVRHLQSGYLPQSWEPIATKAVTALIKAGL